MTRSFLFGGSSSGQSQNKYLVEFKAGKMTMKDKIVSADKRKGTVYVNQTEDSLMHFCWKDRTSGVVEDDLIIFPEDVVFKRVSGCTTGRVFVLKFKSSSRRCFYWLQEPKTDRDTEYCNKVNQYLNNPPPNTSRSGTSSSLGGSSTPSQSGGGLTELSSLRDENLHELLNNMSQQQIIQLFGGSSAGGVSPMTTLSRLISSAVRLGNISTSDPSPRSTPETPQPVSSTTTQSSQPATPAPTTASSTTPSTTATSASSPARGSSSTSIQLSDLQNILSGLNVPPAAATPAAAAAGESSTKEYSSVDLSSAITVEALQPLFNNQELMDRLKALLPPATDCTSPPPSEHVRSTVQSPQFQQALSIFGAALQSGQLGPLMQQFEMPADVVTAANSGDMDSFVRALQAANQSGAAATASATPKPKDKDQDKDEDMSLD